jgi:hypothetical protein
MYKYLNTNASNIRRHTSLKNGNQSHRFFSSLPLISDLTLGFAAAHHHLADHAGSNYNISTVDDQQAAAAAAKRKEDHTTVVAQATAATVHREQEALVAAMVAACKTLEKARARLSLTW